MNSLIAAIITVLVLLYIAQILMAIHDLLELEYEIKSRQEFYERMSPFYIIKTCKRALDKLDKS